MIKHDLENTRCYIYLRKSRKDERYVDEPIETTLEKHKNKLLDVAKHMGLIIVHMYKEVVSGDTIAARPQMLDMISAIEEDRDNIDAVLVMDIDRLGRGNMRDQGFLLELLKWNDIKIITPDHVLDLNNEYDEDSFEDDAHFARRELKRIKRRLIRGKDAALEAGFWIWAVCPYGYTLENKILYPHPQQAEIVRMMFDLYVNHNYGASKLTRYLNERNIPRADGQVKWERSTVYRMILNPVYIGKIARHKRVYKNKGGKRIETRLKAPEDWIIYEGKHEGIVDEEIFYKARKLSQERYVPHVHKTKAVSNPLAYFLKCSKCGKTMRQRTSSTKPNSIRCYCGETSSSYIHVVEKKLVELLADHLNDLEVKYSEDKSDYELQHERAALQTALDSAKSELHSLKEQREKQYEMLEKGIYSEDVFLQRSETVRCMIIDNEEKVKKCEENLLAAENSIETMQSLLPKVQKAKDILLHAYPEFSAEDKNAFLQTIVNKVIYEKEKGAKPSDFKLFIDSKL